MCVVVVRMMENEKWKINELIFRDKLIENINRKKLIEKKLIELKNIELNF